MLVYVIKTLTMKAEDLVRLGRAERMMVQRMCLKRIGSIAMNS